MTLLWQGSRSTSQIAPGSLNANARSHHVDLLPRAVRASAMRASYPMVAKRAMKFLNWRSLAARRPRFVHFTPMFSVALRIVRPYYLVEFYKLSGRRPRRISPLDPIGAYDDGSG